jgi:pimeloyl-ACP methyl ester carboxylesterase
MRPRPALLRCVLIIICLIAPAAAWRASATDVQRLAFSVTLADGSPCTVVGYLYSEGALAGKPLQVAVHGATYNHGYWDFPGVNGRSYSYARYMAKRGFAVLAIDQVGAGESCKPGFPNGPGYPVTLYDTAGALKQVVEAMRSGSNGAGHAFDRVVLVGHSAGSVNVIYTQAAWHVADAIVVTAARHLVAPLQPPPGLQDLVAALLPFPYFLVPPDIRSALFHHLPSMDPDVVALDNATADFWTNGQLITTFMAFLDPSIDRVGDVTGPALVQLGEFDGLFRAGSDAIEEALWTGTKVKVRTLPNVGHDFNLSLDAERGWSRIAEWVRETLAESGVGQGS